MLSASALKKEKRLFRAASIGNLKQINLALMNGARIRAQHNNALRLAIYHGHLKAVKCLIDQGSGFEFYYTNALRVAARSNRIEIMRYLLENVVNMKLSIHGALQEAVLNDNFEAVKCLIDYGGDIHIKDKQIIGMAKANRHSKIARYLEAVITTDCYRRIYL